MCTDIYIYMDLGNISDSGQACFQEFFNNSNKMFELLEKSLIALKVQKFHC